MSFHARWDKVLHDIWGNKARSLLVIFSIAIGVAAVGMIHNTVRMIKRDLFGAYAQRNPASVALYISPFPENLADAVEAMRDIQSAEARRTVSAHLLTGQGKNYDLRLMIVPDFKSITINQVVLDHGAATPGLRGMWLERNSAMGIGAQVGDTLAIEMESGKKYELKVSGIVHDMSQNPFSIDGEVLGYINMPTLEWMGERGYYSTLYITVADRKTSREHVLQVAAQARDRVIQPAGYQVAAIQIPGTSGQPGDFWARKQVDGMLLVLQVMSILAIFLSAGLVVNTISAVLVQQTRQIGIMRSVGATRMQIITLYLVYVLALSFLGFLIAIPLGLAGAWGLTSYAAYFLNFSVTALDLPMDILLLQAGLGLLMPVGVALFPIIRGTRISVYNAIYQNGLGEQDQRSWIETQLVRLRKLSPPVMLSLRNTFRNRARLAFTLATLTIAGAMFMAVFSSYSTLERQISEFGRYIAFDAAMKIPGGANKYTAEREAMRISGVNFAEGWATTSSFIVRLDGSESDRVEIVGLPYNARTIRPQMVAGRWLQQGDTWQVVVSDDLLTKEPGIKPGDRLVIKLDGKERIFEVVGVTSRNYVASRIYMDYYQFAKLTGRYNEVDTVRVLATPGAFSEPASQLEIGKQLEKRFENAQISKSTSETRARIFSSMSEAFQVLLIVLLLVAGILAVIGGLGLTGTMGLNVLERTREVGVLRAVGASHRSVRQVVVVEGVVVALISWALSALLSPGVGYILSTAIVRVAFGTQGEFSYSFFGLLSWLVVVILIGIFASLAPARNAARLTVREVLSYE